MWLMHYYSIVLKDETVIEHAKVHICEKSYCFAVFSTISLSVI